MLQRVELDLVGEQRHVEQRARHGLGLVAEHSALVQVQAAHAQPDHGLAGLDADRAFALFVFVGQCAAQCGENVAHAQALVPPLVHRGVFQVEHDARRAGVEHLHHQLGFIGGTGHLVALVLAPLRNRNLPQLALGLACGKMRRQVAMMRRLQRSLAPGRQLLLPGSEALVQRQQKLQKPLWQLRSGVRAAGRTIQAKSARRFTPNCRLRVERSAVWRGGCGHASPSNK